MAKTSTERVRAHRQRKSMEKLAADVQAAGVQDISSLPEPPSRDELLRILGAQARQGNTAAVRLLLEEYRRDGADTPETTPTSVIDELAQRRTA